MLNYLAHRPGPTCLVCSRAWYVTCGPGWLGHCRLAENLLLHRASSCGWLGFLILWWFQASWTSYIMPGPLEQVFWETKAAIARLLITQREKSHCVTSVAFHWFHWADQPDSKWEYIRWGYGYWEACSLGGTSLETVITGRKRGTKMERFRNL